MERQTRITRAGSARRCAYCRGGVQHGGARVCEGCGTCLHADCLAELGSCPTLGCAEPAPSLEQRPSPLLLTLAAHPIGAFIGYSSGAGGLPDPGEWWTGDASLAFTFAAAAAFTLARGGRRQGLMSEQAALLLFWFGYALGWTVSQGLLWRPQLRMVMIAWLITAALALARRGFRARRGGPRARG